MITILPARPRRVALAFALGLGAAFALAGPASADPKVLAKINSVFVTIEPSNRDVTAPTGKKVLYAFFGEKPNHP